MNVKKSPVFDSSNIYFQLEQAAEHIENVKAKVQDKKEFNAEVQQLLPLLESCNHSLANKKLTPDQELDKSVEKLLKALNSFQSIKNDLATKDKINALQVNLFAHIVYQIDTLEQALTHWKNQTRKVQKTNESKQS